MRVQKKEIEDDGEIFFLVPKNGEALDEKYHARFKVLNKIKERFNEYVEGNGFDEFTLLYLEHDTVDGERKALFSIFANSDDDKNDDDENEFGDGFVY